MIEFMSKRFETHILLPEFNIIQQGEQGNDLYCLAKGELAVLVTDQKGLTLPSENLVQGDIFGEIALLCGCLRTATVRTYVYSTVAKLNKHNFDTVCSVYTWFQEKLKQHLKTYKDNMRKYQMKLIRSVDYMNNLKDTTLEEISYHLKQAHFEQNKVIFRAGEPIDCIYFLVHGVVNILINVGDREIIIDSLTQGASVGANGVLGNYNHNFTARASSKVTMYFINKDSLRTCMNI
jgi:CRP-like cAMP-binding protein